MRFAIRLLAGASLLGFLATPAAAVPTPGVYAESGPWTVEAWTEGADSRLCSARIANPSAQADFGSFMRLENDGRQWSIVSDYLISGNSADIDILVDGQSFTVQFSLAEDVVRAPVDQAVIDAIAAGRRLNLNFDPSGQNFSLRGAGDALKVVADCVRGHGLENAGNPGVNAYNGYDIGGTPEAEEDDYAAVRGWRVVSARISGRFAYCAGETDDRGAIWRLGWDGMQWQVAVVADAQPDWSGTLDVDGVSRSISGSAKGGWALLWLGMQELDMIRNGNSMLVDIGRASIEHPLRGTAALITKIEECVQRKGSGGSGGQVAAAPQPSAASKPASGWFAKKSDPGNAVAAGNGDAGCPDDGPRLPITGICAGRAVAYLNGQDAYVEYVVDPSCEWVVNEVQIVEDVLLYKAQRCKGVTAQLEFAGGAHFAQLMVVRSAINAGYDQDPAISDPKPSVWFNHIDRNNIEQELDRMSRQGYEAELRGRSCAIERAEPATSHDGYVFDITPADPKYPQRSEGPMEPQCGPFSAGDGSTRFWRVLGDYAFLFDLSADIYQDFDPETMTLLKKDAAGNWAAVE